MASTRVPLGKDAKLYYNPGNTVVGTSFAALNTIVEVDNVRDLALNITKALADVTTRGNGGWGAEVGTIKRASVEFEMIADTEETYYKAIRAAWEADTPMQFGVFSGPNAPTNTQSDTQGLVAVFSINDMSHAQELEGAQLVSVSMTPTYVSNSTYKPDWVIVAHA